MIAPLRTEPDRRSPVSLRLAAARAVIAALFLPSAEGSAPPIAAWKAWLFIAWIGLTAVVYALSMAGAFNAPC